MAQRKRGFTMWFWLVILAVVAGLAWIRLAPTNPEDWHVDPMVSANQDLIDGVRRRVPDAGAAQFEDLEHIILKTPRTDVAAGAAQTLHVTYVTRSKWMGFPDYTTVKVVDDHIEIWGRQRFGKADLGVNKARVEGWLAELNQTTSQD